MIDVWFFDQSQLKMITNKKQENGMLSADKSYSHTQTCTYVNTEEEIQ